MNSRELDKHYASLHIWGYRGLDLRNNHITNVANPTETQDATTKHYVDTFKLAGDVKISVRNDDHYGWLKCDGRSLSRIDYNTLFNIIGTSFGSDSAATFRLPDCRSKVLGGIGSGKTLGQIEGAETQTLTVNQLPSHTHTGTTEPSGAHNHTVNDPGHTHTQTTINDDYNNSGSSPPGFSADSAGTRTWNNINSSTTGITINSVGNHTHTFTTNSTGSGDSFSIMQPTVFIGNVFIFSGEY